MKTYKNDDEMIDELYNIIEYLYAKDEPGSLISALGYELEEVVVKIREEIEV